MLATAQSSLVREGGRRGGESYFRPKWKAVHLEFGFGLRLDARRRKVESERVCVSVCVYMCVGVC